MTQDSQVHPGLGSRVHREVVQVQEGDVVTDLLDDLQQVQPGHVVQLQLAQAGESGNRCSDYNFQLNYLR